MKRTPDVHVFHELDKVIANYIGNCYCEIAIMLQTSAKSLDGLSIQKDWTDYPSKPYNSEFGGVSVVD